MKFGRSMIVVSAGPIVYRQPKRPVKWIGRSKESSAPTGQRGVMGGGFWARWPAPFKQKRSR